MITNVMKKLFGSRNDRLVKRYVRTVARINDLEPAVETLSDEALAARTAELRGRLESGETLDALLPDAFATVREAARRTLHMRHFDVQMVGGLSLHEGKISEMRTGEGKTLVAPLAAYLNALSGRGVHIVTVNDYLARRDARWMGPLYRLLGMSVGVIQSSGARADANSFLFEPGFPGPGESYDGLKPVTRREAYACDITYGTNNEFGFDYLRDNMAFRAADRVQRGQNFAVVDEVDSILIDEARTPLIISGPAEQSTDLYKRINTIVPRLVRQEGEEGDGDFTVDEKDKVVTLTEAGHEHAEALLAEAGLITGGTGLYDVANISLLHHLNAALRAHNLFHREVDYIVKDNEVIIVDEFTGRLMPGRRWSEGLHQAIEAKEGVRIQEENQTLASITFQNYFRLYDKLSGMTGTADTEAFEFQQIYGLEVVIIPTNQAMIRQDLGDQIYRTTREKYAAIIEDIKDCHQRTQPVLVGTTSIEASEYLSGLLRKDGVAHEVLNAKHHEREAQIVSQAGRPRAVTIATNMAGRGTDIVLGGNLEMELTNTPAEQHEAARAAWKERHKQVLDAGGLHVIGTERHESRRIDNQLRGRSGRQGDPGSSRFYLSLEDSLMRIFGSERLSGLMQRLGMEEGEAIEHPWVTRAIENAQRKVEGRNFDIRKQLLEYDDVANDQRRIIYQERNRLMDVEEISDTVAEIRGEIVQQMISEHIPPNTLEEQWDVAGLEEALGRDFGIELPVGKWLEADKELHEEPLRARILEEIERMYAGKREQVGVEAMQHLEKALMLQVLDMHWKDHLASMDHLRQGIGLRGYAQKNPKQEYKQEAFNLFSETLERIRRDVTTILCRVQVQREDDVATFEQRQQQPVGLQFNHPEVAPVAGTPADAGEPAAEAQTFVRQERKVGRNEPCPCGSGRKYKHCHGKLA